MIKINTSGDYVQLIYVDPVQESVQQELKSDTDAFECSYDSNGNLYLQFGLMRFENPDPTDFTINGSAVTDAADFISKLNALFTGGGGGGSSFLPTTGAGTATGDISGDVNGHVVLIKSGAIPALSINDEGYVGVGVIDSGYLWGVINPNTNDILEKVDIDTKQSWLKMMDNTMGGQMESGFTALASNQGGEGDASQFSASATFNNGVDPITVVTISGNAQTQALVYTALTHTLNGAMITPDVLALDFADDAAAASGGVEIGQLYHNAGALRIRRS